MKFQIPSKIRVRIFSFFLTVNIFPFIEGTFKVKAGMAQMAKGGIVMDVTNAEQARIAEEAGVCI